MSTMEPLTGATTSAKNFSVGSLPARALKWLRHLATCLAGWDLLVSGTEVGQHLETHGVVGPGFLMGRLLQHKGDIQIEGSGDGIPLHNLDDLPAEKTKHWAWGSGMGGVRFKV